MGQTVDENHFDENNLTRQLLVIVMGSDRRKFTGANLLNNACPSREHSGFNFVDNMVLKELNANVGNNSNKALWKLSLSLAATLS